MAVVASLLTEGMLKRLVVILVSKVSQRTDATWDDELLVNLCAEWNVPVPEKKLLTESKAPSPQEPPEVGL